MEKQTATSDVLRVISSSPTDIQPVLETIGERAEKLHGVSEAGVEATRSVFPLRRTDETVTSRAIRTRMTAATRNLGDRVEIRIRDNGTGIPPEVKEKMFNPFFTTKPAGEGTGLGLSITHDIIVKQHSGSIEVDTQPGEFTEVRIVLPRAAAFTPGGRA
jgi:signal transduction histidine kinase